MFDDDLKTQWLEYCLHLAGRPSKIWQGGQRKILQNQRVTLYPDDGMNLDDLGYTEKKGNDLKRLYLHEESRNYALKHWEQREKGKIKHVCFHTFNHYEKSSGKGGKQGPCMLAVTVTQEANGDVRANIPYRSTEFFKKFPADLIFIRDVLLDGFAVSSVTFNFANLTLHPLYFPTVYLFLKDPVGKLRDLQQRDERFWGAIVVESADLLCGGSRNANFMQAQRVGKHVVERIDPDTLEELRDYLRGSAP